MNNNKEYLEFAKEVAYKAGEIMLKYFKQDNGSTYKEDNTIVTLADKEINSYLIKRVQEKFPTHSVDGEEEQYSKSNHIWVCDPVDGTAMYARHIPVAVFSLALVIDGVPEIGVVYDPFTDNLYYASKGNGAFRNSDKISVNNCNFNDMRSLSNIDIWNGSQYDVLQVLKELNNKTYVVSIGSCIRASMCVASGDFNLEIFPGGKRKHCDVAAVKIIVEEAGGKVTNFFGKDQRYDTDINGAIISNGIVHDEVINILKKYIKE